MQGICSVPALFLYNALALQVPCILKKIKCTANALYVQRIEVFTMQCKCNALALYIFLEYNLSEQIKKTVKGGLYMGRNGTTERKIKEI